jgi:HD-like signal output (HDOD) protein
MSNTNAVLEEVIRGCIGTPPVVFKKLQEALKDPDLSLKKFDTILKTDPSLSARLLKFANSSFYAFDTKVETITHALSVVGVKPLTEIAQSMIMMQKFKDILPGTLDMESFWKHNIACGLASRVIAQNLDRDNLEAFYITGMLHDIGFLIISQENSKKTHEIIARCKFDGLPQIQVEEEEFGFTHAQVGALIFKEWSFAPSLIEAVRYHHEPNQAENFPVETAVLHVADYLVDNMKYTVGENYTTLELDTTVLSMTGVTRDSIDNIRHAVNAQMSETLGIFAH